MSILIAVPAANERRLQASIIVCVGLACAACGSSEGPSSDSFDGGSTTQADAGPGDNLGTLPDPVANAGVAYLTHYLTAPDNTDKLMWYRTDGAEPRLEGEMDLGKPTQGMAMDPVNDLLATVSDVSKTITLFKISRPDSPATAVVAPEEVGVFEYQGAGTPISVFFSSYQKRVFVAVSPSDGGIDSYDLYAYDISTPDDVTDPSWLRPIDGWPKTIPVSVYQGVDSARGLLFIAGYKDDKLHVYDVSDAGLSPLSGEPLDLAALYPVPEGQSSQVGFQARNLKVDPWRNRVYIVRSQGIHSEMMAFEYPTDVPRNGAKFGDFATMADLTQIPDAFDLSLAGDMRPNLLDGYDVDFDTSSGEVFMTADTWNGTSSTAIVASFADGIASLGKGCNEFEDFGCFLRYVLDGNPGTYLRTDGSMCTDSTHKVIVATSISTDEADPGNALFFKYNPDHTMERWNAAGGSTLRASSLPVAAACH